MRKLLTLTAVAALAFVVAGNAHATLRPTAGSLAIQIATLDPVVLPGGGSAVVNGSGSGGHLTQLSVAGGTFGITGFVLPVTDPAAFPIVGIQVTASNASGVFGGSGGAGFGGVMPINGAAIVCLFGGGCSSAAANLSVPLSVVGGGGAVSVMNAVNLTVIGAPWTTGTVTPVPGFSAMGFVHGPATLTSSTNNPSGVVQLVSPIFISTNIGASAVLPGFAFLTLHFVPEPGTLVLLGSGIAGLVAFGRSRARK